MMLHVKAYLVTTVCALGALVSAAANGDSNEYAGASLGLHVAHDQLDPSQVHNLTQHVVQARDDAPPPWNSKRTMVIGIGHFGSPVGFHPDKRQVSFKENIKAAIDNLCPDSRLGFRLCETEGWSFNMAVKDSKGNIDESATYMVRIGSNTWVLPGLREVLRDAVAEVIATVVEHNCWNPGFNQKDPDGNDILLCKAPDITMVRIDHVGWIVVYIVSETKGMDWPKDVRVCARKDWSKGEAKEALEKNIQVQNGRWKWYELLKLQSKDDLAVETDCFVGTMWAGQGDGWCRQGVDYRPGTEC